MIYIDSNNSLTDLDTNQYIFFVYYSLDFVIYADIQTKITVQVFKQIKFWQVKIILLKTTCNFRTYSNVLIESTNNVLNNSKTSISFLLYHLM